MYGISKLALVAAYLVVPLVGAAPYSPSSSELVERQAAAAASSSWWLASKSLTHGKSPRNADPANYKVFRNVKDYGAVGDGTTDDAAAINKAISDGGRCGKGCNSTTTSPALVYFPPGTYLVTQPIVQFYFTQLVGDAISKPIIKADPTLTAMGMIDSDPYLPDGSNFYTNQNNFYRQVRNLVLDLTARPASDGLAAIHWQVAQATSITNVDFKMTSGSKQLGIFMDNGSGGWMSDLTFDGGATGAFFGSQQFTTRAMKFRNMDTAIVMNWNWLWTLKSLDIDSTVNTGVNMSVGGSTAQTVGSVLIQDSTITPKNVGVATAYDASNKQSNGTLVLDNVDFGSTAQTVVGVLGGKVPNPPTGKVASWVQGSTYTTGGAQNATSASGQKLLQAIPSPVPTKPASLLSNGKVAEYSKPQYENATKVYNVQTDGTAKGDGETDDSAALQAAFDAATPDVPVFIPHGQYVIKNTIKITKSVNIVGEVWPVLMADAASFSDMNSPKVMIQVGDQANPAINVQMSDLIISTNGPAKGAILMEWNVKGDSTAGSAGLWDVHWRIGGFAGSNLQSDVCPRGDKGAAQPVKDTCYGANTLFHMTASSSGYFENVWWWVADHELDIPGETQINIFSGRGVLIESQGPSWWYGTASEHSQLYNYRMDKAANVYIGAVQTETSYLQGGVAGAKATDAFPLDATETDLFADCDKNDDTCLMTWGLHVQQSSNIWVYGAGFYSFFQAYDQSCLKSGGGKDNCQKSIVKIDDCSQVQLFGLTTKAAVEMVSFDGGEGIQSDENVSTFGDTVALVVI